MARDLVKLVETFQDIELRNNEDIHQYEQLARAIGSELYLLMHFHADELEARLSRYTGKWYTFGVTSKARARLVSARLRIGAEGFKAAAVAGVKMHSAFVRHFVDPERIAKQRSEHVKGGDFDLNVD